MYGGREGLSDFSPDNASNIAMRWLSGILTGAQGLGKRMSNSLKDQQPLKYCNFQHWYRLHVSEDTKVGTVLLKLTATDDDGGDNARIGYRLAGGDEDHVKIDEKTGELTLARPLDREANSVLRHAVIAFDHGAPSQISAVNLTIEVDDVRIPEDYPDGALVGCVAATDPDVGANARLRFSIEPEENGLSPPFKIDHRTGCVFIHSPHQPLDFQRRSLYNMTIDVADNGEVVLSTTCSLVVELEDVDENLHPPEFGDVALEASVYGKDLNLVICTVCMLPVKYST
ncbi:cadherin domain protein [Oesophagostomum dentatum]|uniref:Cadherin domain protein n=1 Tax=Oesophagostomum dentatum TaxID=61180 RepID=A0A0B1RXB1_OESDE|nr:cadherin domain protein [Oesophagostomum dentatum]